MGTNTLTEMDQQLLRQLSAGPESQPTLQEVVSESPETVADRLEVLTDSGLLGRTDDKYELTASGRRVLAAPSDGSADNQIDVPPAVEAELRAQAVDGACGRAVRAAYTFIQYWGEATASELRDAIFFEWPVGYDDRQTWWDDCVEPVFETLPTVTPPTDPDSPTADWQYEGTPGIDDGTTDGREVLGSVNGQPVGNARQAIEGRTESAAQRTAVRQAFAQIETTGRVDHETLEARIVDTNEEIETGSDSIAAVLDVLESVPSVLRVDSTGLWRYQHQAQ